MEKGLTGFLRFVRSVRATAFRARPVRPPRVPCGPASSARAPRVAPSRASPDPDRFFRWKKVSLRSDPFRELTWPAPQTNSVQASFKDHTGEISLTTPSIGRVFVSTQVSTLKITTQSHPTSAGSDAFRRRRLAAAACGERGHHPRAAANTRATCCCFTPVNARSP
jgi:hypothetical protein